MISSLREKPLRAGIQGIVSLSSWNNLPAKKDKGCWDGTRPRLGGKETSLFIGVSRGVFI